MNDKSIKSSLLELKGMLKNFFGPEVELYLFGSVARKDYRPDSDIDILVLMPGLVDTDVKERVIDLSYEIELKHDVVFGIVVRSKEFWQSPMAAVMPFHQTLQNEGLRI